MTWGARFRLLLGLILVLAVVAGATLVFNQRQNQVPSDSAAIVAAQYPVGTDYGGIVVESYVSEGEHVAEGDRMYAIESLTLARDIAQGLVADDATSMTADGLLIVRASVSGTVSSVDTDTGAYASAGGVLATIERDGTLSVDAEFVLSPRDFARIEDEAVAELRLPDGSTLPGSVSDLTVTTVDGYAHVTASIASPALVEDGALVTSGTPLDVTLRLRDDGPLAGPTDAIADLARRIGL